MATLAPALERRPRSEREAAVASAVVLGAGVVLGLWWADTPTGSLHSWSARLIAAGDVTGLIGTYLVLVEVVLLARVPWLDRLIGMDRLAVWHRRNGQYSITLLVAHALLTIWGYAVADRAGPVTETKNVVLSYPDVLAATVGLGLLVAVGVVSARAARRRLRYQTWYFIHLYTYVAIAVSFAHQFATGPDFVTHRGNRIVWIGFYVITFALLATYRVAAPLHMLAVHRLCVAGVVREGPDAVSVYITGRQLGRLRAEAGQFFLWRFLTPEGWWQAHPFSLSAPPNPDWLRITSKELGDHSRSLAYLRPGTPVIAEGPYGAFTVRRRSRRRVLLIAGGIGITPIRALLEALPGRKGDLTLLYRASRPEDVIFREELDRLAAVRGIGIHYLLGPRHEAPSLLGKARIRALVPDVDNRDVYVCGPPGMVISTRDSLRALGVPAAHIHTEEFEL